MSEITKTPHENVEPTEVVRSVVTRRCDNCGGTGWARGFICGPCDGSGRVPDVEATLRAEVARLTEERDRWKSCAQREPSDSPGIIDRLTALYYAAARLGTPDAIVWMLAADARIQGTYAAFFRRHPEHGSGNFTLENSAAASSALAAVVHSMVLAEDEATEADSLANENARLTAEVERLKAELAETSDTATNRLIELMDSEKRADWAEVEVERLVGREREAKPLMEDWLTALGDSMCPTCEEMVRLDGSDRDYPHAPGCARAAWLAGCKSV